MGMLVHGERAGMAYEVTAKGGEEGEKGGMRMNGGGGVEGGKGEDVEVSGGGGAGAGAGAGEGGKEEKSVYENKDGGKVEAKNPVEGADDTVEDAMMSGANGPGKAEEKSP